MLGWLVAVLIRLGTGSATVATITAAGIVAPLAPTLSANHLALLVLAIGCGSLFFSHVNDAGFWLVKEYFGLTVGRDDQVLVGDGDRHLGVRLRPRDAGQRPRHLAPNDSRSSAEVVALATTSALDASSVWCGGVS